MNEQAFKELYEEFKSTGYLGTEADFKILMSTNSDAFNDGFSQFTNTGYNGDADAFAQLIGVSNPLKKKIESDFISQDQDGVLVTEDISLATQPQTEQDFFEGTFGDILRGFDTVTKVGLGDFVDDMARSVATGYYQGQVAEDASDILIRGANATDEDIYSFIEANKEAQKLGPSDEMMAYQKTYEENGKGFMGVVMGLAKSGFQVIPEVIVSSMFSMFTNKDSLVAAGTVLGSGTAIGAGSGAVAGGVGAIPGAIAGAAATLPYAFAAAGSVLEMGATFSELLQEEIEGELTPEKIREALNDDKIYTSIRNKALARGITIGVIDAFTGRLGGKVAGKILSKAGKGVTKGTKIKSVLSASGIESVGGSVGEATARGVIGQEMDVSEIALEGIAEAPGGIKDVISARFSKPKYKVNGKKVDVETIDNLIETMTLDQLQSTKISIDNDYEGRAKKLSDRILQLNTQRLILEANPDINPETLSEITKLQLELSSLEGNKTEVAKEKASIIKAKIKDLQENQLEAEVDTEVDAFRELEQSEQLKYIEQASKELVEESEAKGDEEFEITEQQNLERAVELFNKDQQTDTEAEVETKAELEAEVGVEAEVEVDDEVVYEMNKTNKRIWSKDFEILDNRQGQEQALFDEEGNKTSDKWWVVNKVTGQIIEVGTKAMAKDVIANAPAYAETFGDGTKVEANMLVTPAPAPALKAEVKAEPEAEVTSEVFKDEQVILKEEVFSLTEPDGSKYRITLRTNLDGSFQDAINEVLDANGEVVNTIRFKLDEGTNGISAEESFKKQLGSRDLFEKIQEKSGKEVNSEKIISSLTTDQKKKLGIKTPAPKAEVKVEEQVEVTPEGNERVNQVVELSPNFREDNGEIIMGGISVKVKDLLAMTDDKFNAFVKDVTKRFKLKTPTTPQTDPEISRLENEIENDQMSAETILEEITIEQDNYKEEVARIKEEKAKIRKDKKLSKEQKIEAIEEKVAEQEDLKDERDGVIESYRDDLKQKKSEIRKAKKALEKITQKPRKQVTKVEKQVDNARKALNKLDKDIKIVVHNDDSSYRKATGEDTREQSTRGEYNPATKTIHINATKVQDNTVAHEVFHALLLRNGITNKQAKAITDRMLKAVKKTASPELLQKLKEHSDNYDSAFQSEESIAELFGILASEYKSLDKPTQNLVQRWINKLANILGVKKFTDAEVIDLLNVVSAKVEAGQEITEQDVAILDGSVSGVINGQARKQDSVLTSFTLKRFPTNPNIKLSEDTPLSNFNQKKSNLLESDRMTGAFIADAQNNPVFKFFGGIYFPQITGKWWASRTLSKATSIAENMNANRDKDGYIYATPIIMKPNSHMSNQDMFETVWEFMKFDLRSKSSKVTKKLFSEYLTKALTLKSVNLTESDLNIKKSDNIETMITKLNKVLLGDDTTLSFEKRKAIIKAILGDPKVTEDRKFPTAGSISEVASKFEEEKTKQATKLWDIVMLMRTKGTLSTKVTPKSDEFYHKSYPAEISSDQEIEVFFLDGAYNIDTTYPELTQSSGKVFSWKEYSEKHPSTAMALSQYGRTAKLSKASGDIVAPQSRKQMPGGKPPARSKFVPIEQINSISRGRLHKSVDSFNALKESIAKDGIKEALVLKYNNKENKVVLMEGHHRLEAANQLGITYVPIKVIVNWDGNFNPQGSGVFGSRKPKKKLDISYYKKMDYFPTLVDPSEIGLTPIEFSNVIKDDAPQSRKQMPGGNADGDNVVQFIRDARGQGISNAAIKTILNKRGVAMDVILESFKEAGDIANVGSQVSENFAEGFDRVMKEIDGVVEKVKNRNTKDSTSPKKLYDAAVSYLKGTKLYENATDVQREKMIVDLRKKFNQPIKKSITPQAAIKKASKKLGLDIKEPSKITLTQRQAIASQIKSLNRGAKDGIRSFIKASKAVAKEVSELVKKGKITANQASVIITRFAKVNMLSESSIDSFVDYMARVFTNADYANTISIANSKRGTAKKNSSKGIGILNSLSGELQKIFSINPRMIPDSVLDNYMELINIFGSPETVLGKLPTLQKTTMLVNDILDTLNQEMSLIPELNKLYNEYEKVLNDDGEVSYAKTIKKMLKEEVITESEFELMKKYKSDIVPAKEKKELSEKEIKELKEDLKKEIDFQIAEYNPSNKDTQLPTRLERDAVKSLIKLSRNDKALDGLSLTDLKNLSKVFGNINNGYFPSVGFKLTENLQSVIDGEINSNAISRAKPAKISMVISRIKSLITKKDSIVELVRRNPLFNIDQIFGDYKTKDIFKSLFSQAATGVANFNSDLNVIQRKVEKAITKVRKSKKINNDGNNFIKSAFEQMAWSIQNEFITNPESNQVNPVNKWLEATIKRIDKGTSQFSFSDAEVLQGILDTYYDADTQEFDNDALYESFNAEEKASIETIREINAGLTEKAVFTKSIIRGDKFTPLNNNIHINVLSATESVDISSGPSFAGKINEMMRPSSRGGNLEGRTGLVSKNGINFNIYDSVLKGSKGTLIDFHLTSPIRTARKTINKSEKNLEKKGRIPSNERLILNAISSAFEESVSNLLINSYTESSFGDAAMQFLKETGYRTMLAGSGRFIAELTSNASYAMVVDPQGFIVGTKVMKSIDSELGPQIARNLGWENQGRLYADGLSGRMIDSSIINEAAGMKSKGTRSGAKNFLLKYWNKTGQKYVKGVEFMADVMISTPDKLILRPITFGSFDVKFKEITGKSPDYKKIAANNEAYMNANKSALNAASQYANKKSVFAGATDNAFMGILKGTKKPNQSGLAQAINTFNNFMTRFLIYEYVTARTGIVNMVGRGDLSKKNGAALLAGVTSRMMLYTLIGQYTSYALSSLLDLDDDDDDYTIEDGVFKENKPIDQMKGFQKVLGQSFASTFTSLLLGRDFGNVAKSIINYGVEEFNKENLQFLRDGKYDQFKDSIQYTVSPKKKSMGGSTLGDYVLVLGAPFGPVLKTVDLIIRKITEPVRKTGEARERQLNEIGLRIPLEILGNLGMIPMYKDVRKAVLENIYKDLRKALAEAEDTKRIKEEMLQGFDSESDMKRYDYELWSNTFGPNSPGYDAREAKKKLKAAERKVKKQLKDELHDYTPKVKGKSNGFGRSERKSSGFGRNNKKSNGFGRSNKKSSGFGRSK